MTQVKRRKNATKKAAATNDRNFRTFLLMSQLDGIAIGARIRQARDEAGLTQEELDDLAEGFKKRSLQDYEAGVTIPYKHLREISDLLNKPVEWFLHGDPPPGVSADLVTGRLEELEKTVTTGFEAVEAAIEQLAARLPRRDQKRG